MVPAPALAQTETPLSAPAVAPRPYVVAIVPGHGGDDPGAIFPPNSDAPQLEEKDLTLPIALELRDKLQHEDVKVVMTRIGDTTTTGEQRAAIAEQAHANAFVAVHINSFFEDDSVRGVEAQYFSDPALADDVADGLVLSLHQFQETVRTTKDREQDNILTMPGVIVEAGYLSNAEDRRILQTNGYQAAVAEGIYQGLLKYAPQIPGIKQQIEAYQAERARAAQEQARRAAALPVWLIPAGIGGAVALGLLAIRSRARQSRRPSRGSVTRHR